MRDKGEALSAWFSTISDDEDWEMIVGELENERAFREYQVQRLTIKRATLDEQTRIAEGRLQAVKDRLEEAKGRRR